MRKTAIDLFCGAGGLSEGFRQAGFHVLAGNDFDQSAGRTYERTHKEAKFLPGPIQNIGAADLLRAAGLKPGELDVLIGGPPCQAYSIYNHQRGLHDDRANLFREYLRIVEGIQPKWVVVENVTGILSIANGTIVDTIKAEFRRLGYRVEHATLKAEDYGVPQERRRVFFIGTRTDAPIVFPEKTHGPSLKPYTSIWDAIGDLPSVENGEDPGLIRYESSPSGWFQQYARGNAVWVENHTAPKLGQINLERIKHIPQGGSWRDIPFELLPAGMQRAKRSDHTKRYGRMKPDGLSCTVLTKCDIHWGAYIHPNQERAITVREAARIQSFPDWFVFEGSKTDQYVQVGNAVPPLLGRRVAEALLTAFDEPGTLNADKASRSMVAA
jgi:DNA (cytosine-5)-methyltransferase 1